MRNVKIGIILILALLAACQASEYETVIGLYVNYDGAEYENALVLCGSDDVWKVDGNEALKELHKLYQSSDLSEYGELLIEVKGSFSRTSRSEFPTSHYAGEFHIADLVDVSTDVHAIEDCRAGK